MAPSHHASVVEPAEKSADAPVISAQDHAGSLIASIAAARDVLQTAHNAT
jgi:hypothetical protein